MKPILNRLTVKKTMVTLHIDMALVNQDELFRLLRKLEIEHKSAAFHTLAGSTLVWQLIVDDFDEDFWVNVAKGNNFELYTHQLDRHW